jgi:hypothetical protein
MRHIIAGVVIEGQRNGEFRPCSVKTVDDLLFSLVESGIFRLCVLGRSTVSEVAASARLFAEGLLANGGLAAGKAAPALAGGMASPAASTR